MGSEMCIRDRTTWLALYAYAVLGASAFGVVVCIGALPGNSEWATNTKYMDRGPLSDRAAGCTVLRMCTGRTAACHVPRRVSVAGGVWYVLTCTRAPFIYFAGCDVAVPCPVKWRNLAPITVCPHTCGRTRPNYVVLCRRCRALGHSRTRLGTATRVTETELAGSGRAARWQRMGASGLVVPG